MGVQMDIVEMERPSRTYLAWAVDVATESSLRYSGSRMLRHSKKRSIGSRRNNFVFCVVEERPVGFMTFRYSRGAAYVLELHVAVEWRSRGIGARLLERSWEKHAVERVVLHVYRENVRGIAFYQRNGFEIGRIDGRHQEMVLRC